MEDAVRKQLKKGFTLARWGIDVCWGALFIGVTLVISSLIGNKSDLLQPLVIAGVLCMSGLVVFATGRTMVGMQSRKLNLDTERPLSEEERWFVGCMLEIESAGAGVNFYNNVARNTGHTVSAGAASSVIVNRFFEVGKKYMGSSLLINHLPLICGAVISAVILLAAL